MKTITMYRAADGTDFMTADECRQYERYLETLKGVDGFLKSEYMPYTSSRTHKTAKAIIAGWEEYNLSKMPQEG